MLAELQCRLLSWLIVIQLRETWTLLPNWGEIRLLVSSVRNIVPLELCSKFYI